VKPPLVLGNEGAGVVEEGGGSDFPAGSRVMFFGAYGAFEDGTYSEWVDVRKEDLCLIPNNVDDVSAAGIPVAYLTAQVALTPPGGRPLCVAQISDRVLLRSAALVALEEAQSTTKSLYASDAILGVIQAEEALELGRVLRALLLLEDAADEAVM
jgi:hypothetical protein